MYLLHVFDDVIFVSASEVVPVLVVSTAEQTIIVLTAAEVDGRKVVVDGAQVTEVNVLFGHTITTPSIIIIIVIVIVVVVVAVAVVIVVVIVIVITITIKTMHVVVIIIIVVIIIVVVITPHRGRTAGVIRWGGEENRRRCGNRWKRNVGRGRRWRGLSQ